MKKYVLKMTILFVFASVCQAITFDDLQEMAAKDPNIHGRVIYMLSGTSRNVTGEELVTEEELTFDGNTGRYKLTITNLIDPNVFSFVQFGKAGWCAQIYTENILNGNNRLYLWPSENCKAVPCFRHFIGNGKVELESVDLEYIPDPNELKISAQKGTEVESDFLFEDGSGNSHIVHSKIRQNKQMDIDEVIALAEEAKELYKEKHGK